MSSRCRSHFQRIPFDSRFPLTPDSLLERLSSSRCDSADSDSASHSHLYAISPMAHSAFPLIATHSRLWPILHGPFSAAKWLDAPQVIPRRQLSIRVYRETRSPKNADPTWPVRAGTHSRLRSLRLHGADGRSSHAPQILPQIRSQLGSREPTLGHLPPSLAPPSLSLSPRNRGWFVLLLRRGRGSSSTLSIRIRPPAPARSARTAGSRPSARLRPSVCRRV